MVEQSIPRTQLCRYCANSIAEDAVTCTYCKADLLSDHAPKWLKRDGPSSEPRVSPNDKKKFPIPAKFIWPAAMLAVALLAFFAGGYRQRSQLLLSSQTNLKQLQAKDQMIQSQEGQLAQTRQQLNDSSTQLAELKTKLDESQKQLAAAQQRQRVAAREVDRSNSNRSVSTRRTASRAPDTAAPLPTPAAARRTAESGLYETTQATSVYDNPSSSARVISQIGKGTRITVVSSAADWLEVRSKHGNPPGYVRAGDARPITRVN